MPAIPGTAVRGRRAVSIGALLAAGVALGVLADRTLGTKAPDEPPTYRRLTFDRGTLGHARFAPDGNTIVYDAAWRGEPSEVFTARIDSRESRSLGLRSAVVHAVSSTSELAVGLRSAGLFATLGRVPLAGGAPREVLENVAWADWSPDSADLAVVHFVDGVDRLEFPIGKVLYESKGGSPTPGCHPGETGWHSSTTADRVLRFSAGSVVAVDRTGAAKTLSTGWADLYGLAWRPDGREVWFTAARRNEFKALRAVTLAGEERLVTRVMGQLDLEDVSRNGRVLVGHPNFRYDMVARVAGESKERELTWLGLSQAADLSKDGSRVLFTELPEGAGEGGSTYLRPTDGSPAVRLGDGVAQALSPDGKWALSILTSPSRLVLLPTAAGQARDLTRPGLTYLEGARFIDSRRVLFAAESNGAPRATRRTSTAASLTPSAPRGWSRRSSLPMVVPWLRSSGRGRPCFNRSTAASPGRSRASSRESGRSAGARTDARSISPDSGGRPYRSTVWISSPVAGSCCTSSCPRTRPASDPSPISPSAPTGSRTPTRSSGTSPSSTSSKA